MDLNEKKKKHRKMIIKNIPKKCIVCTKIIMNNSEIYCFTCSMIHQDNYWKTCLKY
jgi:hypothetical protein